MAKKKKSKVLTQISAVRSACEALIREGFSVHSIAIEDDLVCIRLVNSKRCEALKGERYGRRSSKSGDMHLFRFQVGGVSVHYQRPVVH